MAWYERLMNTLRPQKARSEIDEEVQHHIESRIEDNLAEGMSQEEARSDALRRFGGSARTLDAAHDEDIYVWIDTIFQDLRYGIRNLISNPGVTLVTLVSLALAIGANTAIFSVVDAVLLRALPYREPNRLALLWQTNVLNGAVANPSVPNFEAWKLRAREFDNLAIYREADASFLVDGEPDWIQYAWVHGDFFQLLGRGALLGRVFRPDSDDAHEVVLSHRLWRSRFGGSTDVVGRTVNVSGIDFQIVGVMPETFAFPSKETQLWAPAAALPNWQSRREDRRGGFGTVVGRLRSGITLEQARAEMQVINSQLIAEYPQANQGRAISIVPLAAQIHGKTVPFMLGMLFAAVFLVLLIACANTGNLLLARGAVRKREIALRAALGAGKGRIMRQLVTESILLSALAGALGLPIAAWGVRALIALSPAGIARLDEAHVDARVLVFSFALSVATGLLFGLAPALRMSRDVSTTRQTAGIDSRGMRRAFVIIEVALSVVLLTGAGLLIRSLVAVESVDPGFQTARVLTATLRFRNTLKRDQRAALYREAMTQIGQLSGVSAAGAISTLFFTDDEGKFGLRAVEGRPPESREQWEPMTWSTISGEYFQALGVPLLRGRFFTDRDTTESTPVVIINETMARRYWPDGDPLGKGIKGFDPRGHNDEWVRVIGVVKDMHSRGLERSPIAQIYQTQAQSLDETENLVVHTNASPTVLRDTIRSIDKTAVWTDVATLEDRLRQQNAPRRFQTLLLGLFASVALALAGAGIFAMLHYSVAQRTRELGIRIAMGASSANIVQMILRESSLLVSVGLGIGLACSLALTRSIRSLLFEVGPGDPATLAAVSLLLAGIALGACYVPARRACRIDPNVALRYE
jgi:predicted permease